MSKVEELKELYKKLEEFDIESLYKEVENNECFDEIAVNVHMASCLDNFNTVLMFLGEVEE